MAYAIARLKKLKRSNIAGSASHANRERETPNADPSLDNIRFIGGNNLEERLEDLVLAKIGEHEQKRKIRTDGVYCVELLLSASPSYFRPDCPRLAGYYEQEKKDFYRIVESGRDLEVDDLNSEELKAKALDRDRAARRKEEMEATAKALLKENELLQKRIQELEEQNQLWQQQTEQLRDLPLDDVAWELGLHHEQNGWRGENHIINIDGSKFSDLDPGSPLSRNGAIDLVMHVNQCDLRQAVVWLHERFGESGAIGAAIAKTCQVAAEIIQLEPRTPFKLPVEDKTKWQAVEHYLTKKRGIPENYIGRLGIFEVPDDLVMEVAA